MINLNKIGNADAFAGFYVYQIGPYLGGALAGW